MDAHRYAALVNYVDLLLDAICVVDPQGRYVFVSAGFERVFGYAPDEVVGRPMLDLVHPADREKTLQTANAIMGGEDVVNFENRYLRKDGEVVYILWSARWSEADQVRVAVARDITDRKHTELRQAALYAVSEAAFASEDLPELYQRVHRIIADTMPANAFAIALYDNGDSEPRFPYRVEATDPGAQPVEIDEVCARVAHSGQAVRLDPDGPAGGDGSGFMLGVPLRSHHGTIGALLVRSSGNEGRYSSRDTELLEFVSTQIATAIERKQLLDRLRYIAMYDPLTQLPNRALFKDRIHVALAKARRDRVRLALLYLDLDDFKTVNDTFGHAAGDALLHSSATRLSKCVRQSDTVARLGGDEFVILMENVEDLAAAERVAEKIHLALCSPHRLNGCEVATSASIGIAMYPEHGTDEQQLLLHADQAMYRTKRAGSQRLGRQTGR